MKKLLLTCLALLAISTTTFAYKIGDVITVGGKKGVVFEVSSDGQHGKVVSLYESEEGDWYSANKWCSEMYGRAWRLPTTDEWLVIYKRLYSINSTLACYGYTQIGENSEISGGEYWAFESDAENLVAWTVTDSKINRAYIYLAYPRARAIAAF